MYGLYFPEHLVHNSVRTDIHEEQRADGRSQYFFHIDPALSGARYAIVGVKRIPYPDRTGMRQVRIVLVYSKTWDPDPKKGLDLTRIEDEVLQICRRFRPSFVTFDQFQSVHMLGKIQRAGYRCLQTAFNRGYKNKIFQNLKDLMSHPDGQLWIYDDALLMREMLHLKFKPTPRGQSIGADKRGECPTDDLVDCLAGAAFLACGQHSHQLPESSVVYTGSR